MYASAPICYSGAPLSTGKGPLNAAASGAAQTALVKRIALAEQAKRRAEAKGDTALVSKLTLQIIAMQKSLDAITLKTGKAPPSEPPAALQPGQSSAQVVEPSGVATMDVNGTVGASAPPASFWHKNKTYIVGGAVLFGLAFAAKKLR